jgi:6-phosphogluconolactonase
VTNLTLEIFPEADMLLHAAAERIAEALETRLQGKEDPTLVLTGGKTPKPAYELLSMHPYGNRIDWARVDFFWGDERCVPPDNPESNFGMAWNALISKINAPSHRIHRIAGELNDAERAASLYESEIRSITSSAGIPSFDLVLLGMGEDGHTASLFPGTHWDEERLVVANRMPQSGANRISMTPRLLNGAKTTIFMVSGLNKAKALADVLENPGTELPAARIRPARGRLTWMVDRAAASQLIRNSKFEIRDWT